MEIILTADDFQTEALIQIEELVIMMVVEAAAAAVVEAIKITITTINRLQASLNLTAAIQTFKFKEKPYSYKTYPNQLRLKI